MWKVFHSTLESMLSQKSKRNLDRIEQEVKQREEKDATALNEAEQTAERVQAVA